MKSNQLNIIAALLLVTAGLSANYDAVQTAYDVVRGTKNISVEEAKALNLKDIANQVAAMNIATDKSAYTKAILVIADKNATFVQRNKERMKRNVIDPVMRNKRTILKTVAGLVAAGATAYAVDRYAFEGKGLKYTQETASQGLTYTKNAGKKALDNTKAFGSSVYTKGQECVSWLYSKLPAKPTWFGMPTFVSNMFGKKQEPVVKPQVIMDQDPYQIGL